MTSTRTGSAFRALDPLMAQHGTNSAQLPARRFESERAEHRSAGLLCASSALLALAACSTTSSRVANTDAPAQFEQLKRLAGSWTTPANENHGAGTIRYTLTAGGSAVQEEFYPGEPHAMVTLYHMDGPDLVLTHYCSARNQPRMRAGPSRPDGTIPFDFDGGTNLDPERDGHMHACAVRVEGPRAARTWWTYFVGGKHDHTTEFVLTRP